MRQAAEPRRKASIDDKGKDVAVLENAGGDAVHAADEEVVEHPVHVSNDAVVSRVCPHIMPCAMGYSCL